MEDEQRQHFMANSNWKMHATRRPDWTRRLKYRKFWTDFSTLSFFIQAVTFSSFTILSAAAAAKYISKYDGAVHFLPGVLFIVQLRAWITVKALEEEFALLQNTNPFESYFSPQTNG